jgi:hypothetical protein
MIYDARRSRLNVSLFKREGLPVEVLDELHWQSVISLVQPLAPDRGYPFWPATIGDAPTPAMEAEGS